MHRNRIPWEGSDVPADEHDCWNRHTSRDVLGIALAVDETLW